MDIELEASLLLQSSPARKGVAMTRTLSNAHALEAVVRALLLRDAEREAHDAFRREVSEFALGVKEYMASVGALTWQQDCDRFIIQPKTDPLAEVFDECFHRDVAEGETWSEAMARKTRAALKSRGLEIREAGE